MDDNSKKLLLEWQRRVREHRTVHYEASKHYERRNLFLGIPVVVLTTVVGTSVFAALGKSVNPAAQIAVGLCSVIAAIFAGLQTFLRYAERAEKHRVVAVRYGALNREFEQLLAFGDAVPHDDVSALRKRIDDLGGEAPSTPTWIWELVVRQLGADGSAWAQPQFAEPRVHSEPTSVADPPRAPK